MNLIARTGIVLSGEKIGNDIRVKFPTTAAKTYRVDYTKNLPPSSWSALQSSISGTGGEGTVTDTNAVSFPRRFYRVVRLD